jgi:hypothetical protein
MTIPAQAKVVRHEVPKIKLTTLVRRNGHAHVKPTLSSTANDRSEIPLGNDFKDF